MTFVQIIEMTTTKAPEIGELMDGWMAATEGRRSAGRGLLTKDRERPIRTCRWWSFPPTRGDSAGSADSTCDLFRNRPPAGDDDRL